jgi:probable F420-dependent oxidoreductase
VRFAFAESMTDPSYYPALARTAEDVGFDAMIVPDSICYPEHADSTYPYNGDGTREFLDGKPFIEPFSLIPALAAVTERLRFHTFVVKLPIRHPVLTAKQVTSVGVLTGNRFGFGVGTSPWREDYAATGVPWERRGARMDECIEIIRGLASGEYFEYHGEFYDVPSVKLCPVPTERVPILVGGHSRMGLERAARLGDGWMHAGSDLERLDEFLDTIDELRKRAGRDHLPFERHVVSFDAYTPDGIRRLEDRGVTDAIIGFRDAYQVGPDTQPLSEKLTALRRFADDVIAKVR